MGIFTQVKLWRGPPFLNKIAPFPSSFSFWSYLRGGDSIGFVGGILERKCRNLFR